MYLAASAVVLIVVSYIVVSCTRQRPPEIVHVPGSVPPQSAPQYVDGPDDAQAPETGCFDRPVTFHRAVGLTGSKLTLEVGKACEVARTLGGAAVRDDPRCAARIEVSPWFREQITENPVINGRPVALEPDPRTGRLVGWTHVEAAGLYRVTVGLNEQRHSVAMAPNSFQSLSSSSPQGYGIGRSICFSADAS